jgi:hypothetical protein
MDMTAESADFLIAAMEIMIADTEKSYGRKTTKAEKKIENIKKNSCLELD